MELRIYLVLTCCALLAPAAGEAAAVKQFPLNERIIYEIPISGDVPTTVMFPSAPTAIEGANVTTNAEAPAPVLLAYTPGRNFFSVRAIAPNARAAINVVWKNRTYLLRFFTAGEPYGSVTFFEEEAPTNRVRLRASANPESLLAMLDRAKNLPLYQAQYPEAVSQIERSSPGAVTRYRDFAVTIEEVFRFDPEDTLVFRVRFENHSEQEVIYLPQRLAVRVGLNVYYAAISDASGIIPPKGTTFGYFAVSGTPRGGRANLSVKNRFTVIVARVERDARLVVPQ